MLPESAGLPLWSHQPGHTALAPAGERLLLTGVGRPRDPRLLPGPQGLRVLRHRRQQELPGPAPAPAPHAPHAHLCSSARRLSSSRRPLSSATSSAAMRLRMHTVAAVSSSSAAAAETLGRANRSAFSGGKRDPANRTGEEKARWLLAQSSSPRLETHSLSKQTHEETDHPQTWSWGGGAAGHPKTLPAKKSQ